ncbi:hypothetical protein FB192DRAFT_1346055 [Mucor lusitanicus]|nr:hypothetical protein FB192DRAFT_1346055 [Mucor lusitanicus]
MDQQTLLEAFADDFADDDDVEFGDDIDLEQLVQVAETVEQTHAAGQISFVPDHDDPVPPPPLPADTPCRYRFDPEAMRTWVYPTNYPVRGYQLNIVHKAMFNNVLVALPTGLGKTFIAAVVMYNYWRWFPDSKILFLAHTRPLVDQQIEACFTICGIPQDQTAELTGQSKVEKRRDQWRSKRVFFATPQTVQNDLTSGICPAHLISCVVVDEAHKATGNHSYAQVVEKICKTNRDFRILALTATPGSTMDAVQTVVTKLRISKIEIRTEESMDIREFSPGKNLQRIVVKLGYTEGSTGILPRLINDYVTKVFEPMLVDLARKPTSMPTSAKGITTYQIMMLRNRFNADAKNLNPSLRWLVSGGMLVAESACRAYEYLTQIGVTPFIENLESLFEEYNAKVRKGGKLSRAQLAFQNNSTLQGILRLAKQEAQKPDFIGHPKMDHLVSILLNHFGSLSEGEVSKVMVFSSFRSSVMDICKVLDRHRPMIRSTIFVGQATDKQGTKGLNQREQQEVLRKFKSDEFNVLVATSIGEEGLDIGEIDLIVCFDSHSSPIRMLQRMGRTGRKRMGKCILLHTEEEEKKFNKAKDAYASVQKIISRGGAIQYFKPEPQILPANYKPTICRKQIVVGTYQPKITTTKRRKKAQSTDYTPDGFLKEDEEQAFIRSFNNARSSYTSMDQITDTFWPKDKMVGSVCKFVPLQSRLQGTHRVGHSQRTQQLSMLVDKMEYRIMHPDETIHANIPKQMTQFKLPSKFSKNTLTMPAPRKRRKAPSNTRLDDDDFDDFMQNNNIDQIVDWPVPDDDRPARQNQPPVQQQQPTANKGKSRMTLSQEMREINATTEDMDVDASSQAADAANHLTSWDNEPRSWEQMLPDDVFEDVDPLPDLSLQGPSSVQNPFLSNAPQMPTTPPSRDPFAAMPSPSPAPAPASLMSENDSGDDFDFSLDASFLEQADALVKSKTELGFDDVLEPRFDFEKTGSVSDKENRAVTLIWPGRPPFSEKGLQLLQERQKRLEARTGHRIHMQFIEPVTRMPDPQPFAAAPAKPPPQIQQPSPIIDTPPPEKQQLDLSMEEPEEKAEEEQDDFYDLDFNEDLFANFIENKIDEDGYYAENFMFGQDETCTQNIAEQSILHADVAAKQPSTSRGPAARSFTPSSNAPSLSKSTQNQSQKYQWFGDAATKEEDIIEFDVDALSSASDEESATAPPNPVQRQPSIFSIEDSQDVPTPLPPQEKIQDEHDEQSQDESAISPIVHRHRRKIIVSEDEQESPSLLSALSKGLYTPSPLRQGADSQSPVLIRRRLKRPLIDDDDDDNDEKQAEGEKASAHGNEQPKSKGRKRLKRKVDLEEDDDFVVLPPSQQDLKRRLLQSREPNKKTHIKHRRRTSVQEGGLVNPFVEHEAEYSSDGGHTDEDVEGLFNSSASSVLNSFIVDDDEDRSSVGNGSALSASDGLGPPPLILRTPDEDDPIRRNGKHWMNRFNADKWLNVNGEDDSVVVSEEDMMASQESINDFTSDLREPLIPLANDDDDGDYL